MKKKIIWALLFLAMPIFAFSQCPDNVNVNEAIKLKDKAQIRELIKELSDCKPMQDSLALLYHKLGSFVYKKTPEKAIEYTKIALAIRKRILPPVHIDLASSYYNLGLFYKEISEYKLAEEYFKITATIYEKLDTNLLVNSYQSLGSVYHLLGDYKRAIQILELGMQKAKEFGDKKRLNRCYLVSANPLHESGLYTKAINYLKKAAKYYETKKPGGNLVACYTNFSRSYYELKEYEKAIIYGEKAIILQRKFNNPEKLSFSLNNLGLYYLGANKVDKAVMTLEESLAIAKANNLYSAEAHCYDNMGEIQLVLKQNVKAIQHFNKAVSLLTKNESASGFMSNPSEDKLIQVNLKTDLLIYLKDKAAALFAFYKEKSQKEILDSCLDTYKLCDKLIDLLRQEHTEQSSKLFWRKKVLPIYEEAIEASHLAKDYESAFLFFEKSKAILLLDAILNAEALNTIQNDSLLNKEKQLRRARFTTQEKLENTSESEKESILAKLSKINNDLDAFTAQVSKDYPNYHKVKFETEVANMSSISTQLKQNNTALLHYFVGKKKTWLYMLSGEKAIFKALGTTKETNALVSNFLSFFENRAAIFNDPKAYEQAAFDLYKYLIAPAELSEIKELIIVPDGILGFLPFEALITQPSEDDDFSLLNYLIKDYTIRLSFSAAILGKQNRASATNKKLLAFAPFSAKGSGDEFSALPYSNDELFFIEKQVAGEYFKDKKASKAQLISKITDFSVVHISTHASANEVNRQPFIAFPDTNLTLRELYGLNLSTDLIVLSACETNIGEIKSGEGIFSLARGFTYAGAKSIIASLWNVNARSTGKIFPEFYENLKKGKTKSIALREAKLKYINAPEEPGHIKTPYDWAGFVLMGNNENIELKSPSSAWVIWSLLLGVVLLILIKRTRKR